VVVVVGSGEVEDVDGDVDSTGEGAGDRGGRSDERLQRSHFRLEQGDRPLRHSMLQPKMTA
jgi:hypothetical protein